MAKERERQTRKDQKGRILKKGEGQDKNGRYYYVYVDASGKRKRIYNMDLIELRETEQAIQRDIKDGIDINTAKRTLNEQFAIYLATKEIRNTTKADYMSLWNRCVKDDIGKRKLINIKKSDLQIFFKKLSDKGYSNNTIKMYCNNLIHPTLELALDDDIIRKNPAKGCMKEYNSGSKTKDALTVAEQQSFLEYVENSKTFDIYYPLFTVMFSTACRCGEIIGLTWNDIDFKSGYISINHQLVYKNCGGGCKFYCAEPKTESGKREIPITKKCCKALIRQKEIQMSLGIDHHKQTAGLSNFVFTTSNSTPYMPTSINNLLKNIVNQYNRKEEESAKKEKRCAHLLPHISCHSFRHTGCTRLAENNIDPKTLQEFMGHADISVTMNVYNHVDKDRMKRELEKAELKSGII
ncbi:MAG: site-specific integrase [Lachnospiraceae bacterium]|nr:site-specific integrase [Lachnospiraceae bacterium]